MKLSKTLKKLLNNLYFKGHKQKFKKGSFKRQNSGDRKRPIFFLRTLLFWQLDSMGGNNLYFFLNKQKNAHQKNMLILLA